MAGMYAVVHGRHRDPVAVKVQMAAGISHGTATTINDGISLLGSMGGAGLYLSNQAKHVALLYQVPKQEFQNLTLFRAVKPQELMDIQKNRNST